MIYPKKTESHMKAELEHPELLAEREELSDRYAPFLGLHIIEKYTKGFTREEVIAIREKILDFNRRWEEAGFDKGEGLAEPLMEDIDHLFPSSVVEKPAENFGDLSSDQIDWIKENSKKWEKAGRIRYYINLIPALVLANCVDEEKKGSPVAILGLSKNKSFSQMQSWAVYFDAVSGQMCQNGTRDEVYKAFLEDFEAIHG